MRLVSSFTPPTIPTPLTVPLAANCWKMEPPSIKKRVEVATALPVMEVVPMRRLPEFVTVSSVLVDEPMVKAGVVPMPFGLIEKSAVGVVVPIPSEPEMYKADVVALVLLKFVANKFVDVAFVVVPKMTESAEIDEEAFDIKPAKVGAFANTSAPLPVSSLMSAASSVDVSMEEEEIFSVRSLKFAAVRRPRSVVEAASGMVSVWMSEPEVKPQPPVPADEVAKV